MLRITSSATSCHLPLKGKAFLCLDFERKIVLIPRCVGDAVLYTQIYYLFNIHSSLFFQNSINSPQANNTFAKAKISHCVAIYHTTKLYITYHQGEGFFIA